MSRAPKKPATLPELFDKLVAQAGGSKPSGFRKLVNAAGLDPAKDFVGASLRDVDLRGEDLRGFDFSQADLSGADFRHAKVKGVRFDGANLTGVIGLSQLGTLPDGLRGLTVPDALRGLTVSDVMIPRAEMITVNPDDPPEDFLGVAITASVRRIPLWRETADNIFGVLHVEDLSRAAVAAGGDLAKIAIAELAHPPWFVPESLPLSDQLEAFQGREAEGACVVDEYGEVVGIVTLKDILDRIQEER